MQHDVFLWLTEWSVTGLINTESTLFIRNTKISFRLSAPANKLGFKKS